MLRLAVFIDAGYLWKQLCKALFPGDENYRRSNVNINYSNFHAVLTEYIQTNFPAIPLLRCYWYDGALAGGNLSSEHNKIALLNDFKLRLGSRITETSEGRTRQKGVDGLIIADLIGLAQNKVLSHALLISGDGDMVPGVGVAQALGVRIHLLAVHNENATSPQLKMEADFFDLWTIEKINKFAEVRTSSSDTSAVVCTDSGPSSSAHEIPSPSNADNMEDEETSREAASPTGTPSSPVFVEVPPFVLSGRADPLNEFFDSLTADEKASISQTHIPYDIDRRLIRLAYECNSLKVLSEQEKRAVRSLLRKLAHQFRQ